MYTVYTDTRVFINDPSSCGLVATLRPGGSLLIQSSRLNDGDGFFGAFLYPLIVARDDDPDLRPPFAITIAIYTSPWRTSRASLITLAKYL